MSGVLCAVVLYILYEQPLDHTVRKESFVVPKRSHLGACLSERYKVFI